MSLEDRVKAFAESVRLALLAEIARRQSDTRTAEIVEIDKKGNIKILENGQTRVVKGLGSAYQTHGEKVIFDTTGSIEYKHGTERQPVIFLDSDKKTLPKAAIPPEILVPMGLLFHADEEEEDDPILYGNNAFYMLTYSTRRERLSPGVYFVAGSTGVTATSSNNENRTDSQVLPSFPNTGTGGTTYRIAAACAFAWAVQRGSFTSGTASASVAGLGINLSVTAPAAPSDGSYGYSFDSQYSLVETSDGGQLLGQAQGTRQIMHPYSFTLPTGQSEAEFRSTYITFDASVYYYQGPNNEDDEAVIKVINLNDIVAGRVIESRLVHNYAAREGNSVFVYSIFQAITVDMGQSSEVIDVETTSSLEKTVYIGKIKRFTIHTKLNLATGQYDSKSTESLNTGAYSGAFTNTFVPYADEGFYATMSQGTWLIRITTYIGSSQSYTMNSLVGLSTATWIEDFRLGHENQLSSYRLLYGGFNPEAIWQQSYPGDWIYAYRNIPWDLTAAATIGNTSDLYNFLQLSFKGSKFYHGFDSNVLDPLTSFQGFTVRDATGDAKEGNTPEYNSYSDFALYTWLTSGSSGTFTNYSAFFNGSVPDVPGDYSTWTIQTFDPDVLNPPTATLPDFTLASNISPSQAGNLIDKSKTYFNFIPLDSVRLKTHEITDGVATLVTSSEGYPFNVGDAIRITEEAEYPDGTPISMPNGLYLVYEVDSNTQFKVEVPGVSNTSGAVNSLGVATKLPPPEE